MNSPEELDARLTVGLPLLNHRWDGVLIRGNESADTLRELAHRTSLSCPRGQWHERCPFKMLEGLTHNSRDYLLKQMDRNALLQLFAMEQACRIEAECAEDRKGLFGFKPGSAPELNQG